MLEELQRLQAHINTLKTRLNDVESQNATLLQEKQRSEEQHFAQIVQKNSIITKKQDEADDLTEKLSQLQTSFNQLNTDSTALAERYGRL